MDKKVFISHSKLDKSIAELICTALENENIGCWIAPRDIPYGNDWAGEIASAIENSSLFIFVLSEHSNVSRQCPKEITIADNVGIPIVCVKIDDVEMSQALKYHLSTQQILFLDASNIKEELKIVTSAISDKLINKTSSSGDYTYNVDQQLEEKFAELFAHSAKDTKSTIEKKLDDILSRNFMNRLLAGVDSITNDNDSEKNQKKKFVLSPLEWDDEFLLGKHFSLLKMEGVKTIVFQRIENIIDYATKSEYYNLVLLESVDDEEYTTFFPHKPPKCGSEIIILHFDCNEHRAFTNVGILYADELTMSKKPVVISLQKASINNDVLSLNEVAYENDNLIPEYSKPNETIDKWVDADIKISPIILIDPDTAEPVRRKLYYDTEQECMKAKMLIIPNKSYFAFQICQTESNAISFPLSMLQQGVFYRKGLHGFPKDLMESAQLFEKDGSKEALCELALIFKEPGSLNDPDAYKEYLLRSVEQGCEKAIIELSLGVAFGENSYKTIDECIDLLKNTVTDDSAEGNFVLGYLLENDNPKEAFDLFLKAAKNDYAPAISSLCCSDYTLDGKTESELYDTFITDQKENKGLLEYCMGCACFYGYGIETRKEVGIDLIKKSAYLGDYDSEQLLFDIFDSDEEYVDKTKALFWLEKIAIHDESSLVKLANWYIDGIGCIQSNDNDKKAFACLSSLEHSDNRSAVNNLAWLYKEGRGCEVNYDRAKELFERAAKLDCTASYYHLGTMYEEGLGIDADFSLAKEMYIIAAEKGHKKASERLKDIE